jgi:hypothetical protein
VITIDTPHLGSPLANDLLQDANACVQNAFASNGKLAFSSVTLSGHPVTGAVADLQGNGLGGSLSAPLMSLQNPGTHQLPTALIAGVMNSSNLNSLSNSGLATSFLYYVCWLIDNDPLAEALTPSGWPAIFGQQSSDAIVPLNSQLNGLSAAMAYQASGFVHSGGMEFLGFTGPSVVPTAADVGNFPSQYQQIPNEVINLLNTPVTQTATFISLNP